MEPTDDEREDDGIVRAWRGRRAPVVLAVLAAVYIAAVWSEAVKSGTSARWMPAPLAYFTQIARLFPRAATATLDYRVEGFRCRDATWAEIDVTPFFPIDADNKENRFYRALHFYHDHRPTMRALDAFTVTRYNEGAIAAAAQGRGGERIGGIRVHRLTIPFGVPGEGAERYARRPLFAYPEDERKELYHTPESMREERCGLTGR
jgi:hypothetical protein